MIKRRSALLRRLGHVGPRVHAIHAWNFVEILDPIQHLADSDRLAGLRSHSQKTAENMVNRMFFGGVQNESQTGKKAGGQMKFRVGRRTPGPSPKI